MACARPIKEWLGQLDRVTLRREMQKFKANSEIPRSTRVPIWGTTGIRPGAGAWKHANFVVQAGQVGSWSLETPPHEMQVS